MTLVLESFQLKDLNIRVCSINRSSGNINYSSITYFILYSYSVLRIAVQFLTWVSNEYNEMNLINNCRISFYNVYNDKEG